MNLTKDKSKGYTAIFPEVMKSMTRAFIPLEPGGIP